MNTVSEYSSVYEIAEKYTTLSREVLYPPYLSQPRKESYNSNRAFVDALDVWEITRQKFLEMKKEYRLAQERITQDFKDDLLEFLGVSDHSKAERLWELAWEYGHSSGYSDVASYAEDFSELME